MTRSTTAKPRTTQQQRRGKVATAREGGPTTARRGRAFALGADPAVSTDEVVPTRASATKETRARILDAALHEFAAHGYEAASTNTIAEAAGVAKGLVFHYFGAKDRLYLQVHEDVLARMDAHLLGEAPELPADLFERLHALTVRKLALFRREPALLGFVKTFTGTLPEHVRTTVDARHHAAGAVGWARIVRGLDARSLREGLTVEAAVDTLSVLGDGLERRMTAMVQAGASAEVIAAMAWQHYDRVRAGLGRPATTAPALRDEAQEAITPPATRARGRARRRA